LTVDERNGKITLLSVDTICPTTPVEVVAQQLQGVPVLVTRDGSQTTDLVGIITAFDLL